MCGLNRRKYYTFIKLEEPQPNECSYESKVCNKNQMVRHTWPFLLFLLQEKCIVKALLILLWTSSPVIPDLISQGSSTEPNLCLTYSFHKCLHSHFSGNQTRKLNHTQHRNESATKICGDLLGKLNIHPLHSSHHVFTLNDVRKRLRLLMQDYQPLGHCPQSSITQHEPCTVDPTFTYMGMNWDYISIIK